MKFSELKISKDILSTLDEIGYSEATDIQAQTIPKILAGSDLIGESKTGSGKTLAFSLPILEKIEPELKNLQALILCPTRELCSQVAREVRKLGRKIPQLQVLIIAGGEPIGPQLGGLRMGAQIAVATPGRCVDVFMKSRCDLSDLKFFVLDEADRMLEMGFQDDMNWIMEQLPAVKQTLLFSATFPASIQGLSRQIQNKPVHIVIDSTEKSLIEQFYYEVENNEKVKLLSRILQREEPESALIFCNLKVTTLEVAEALSANGLSAKAINGDLEQDERNEILAQFRNSSLRFLIATDVAARGLDIHNLPLVVNFDLPRETEVYIHRIGRTGRAGKAGIAISLVSAVEKIQLTELQLLTESKIILTTLPPKGDSSSLPRPPEMQTISIGGGRKDKVRPGDILGALTGEAGGLEGSSIGKIEIHDRISYVAIQRNLAPKAHQALKLGRIKGKKFTIRLFE